MFLQNSQSALHQFLTWIVTPQHPGPALIALAQAQSSNPHGIQMDVARHLHHFALLLDQHRLEPSLEHRPAATVRPVELDRVRHIEPAHCVAQVGLSRPHQQMIMVVHQHKGVDLQREAFRPLRHRAQKPPPIRVIQEQRSSPGARDSSRDTRRPQHRFARVLPYA
jgi:hypothetical protein